MSNVVYSMEPKHPVARHNLAVSQLLVMWIYLVSQQPSMWDEQYSHSSYCEQDCSSFVLTFARCDICVTNSELSM